MIVVKPIDITDTILTSTIAEPDVSKGEVVWSVDKNGRPGSYNLTGIPAPVSVLSDFSSLSTIPGSDEAIGIHQSYAGAGGVYTLFRVSRDGALTELSQTASNLNQHKCAVIDGFIWAWGDSSSIANQHSMLGVLTGSTATLPTDPIATSLPAKLLDIGGLIYAVHAILNDIPTTSRISVEVLDYSFSTVVSNFDLLVGDSSLNIVVNKGAITSDDGFIYAMDQQFKHSSRAGTSDGLLYKFATNGDLISSTDISSSYATSDSNVKSMYHDGTDLMLQFDDESVTALNSNFDLSNSYLIGETVISTELHKVYQSTSDNTDDPVVGVNLDVPTWVDIGPTNKYAMFDFTISSETDSASPLVVDLDVETYATAVAGFNIDGTDAINVTVVSDAAGEVYNTDIDMNDNSSVIDAWTYYFEPIIKRDRFILLDLPPYIDATITVTFTGSGNVSVGALVTGPQLKLGVANYNTEIQLLDFSTQARNQFGDFEIVKRSTADLVKFDVTIPKNKVPYVRRQFQELSQVPAVWVGGGGDIDDPTAVFGYYEKFVNNISSPSVTDSTITIQGLV